MKKNRKKLRKTKNQSAQNANAFVTFPSPPVLTANLNFKRRKLKTKK